MAAERDLSVDWLGDYLDGCFRAPERLERMSAAARRRALGRGGGDLADVVERAANRS